MLLDADVEHGALGSGDGFVRIGFGRHHSSGRRIADFNARLVLERIDPWSLVLGLQRRFQNGLQELRILRSV